MNHGLAKPRSLFQQPANPLHKASAELSQLVERALNGEPQRVTRHGDEAVVIIAEPEWAKGPREADRSSLTLVDLFLKHGGDTGYGDVFDDGESRAAQDRPIGSGFPGDSV